MSSVFNIAENDGPEDILIYKRVAHFNKSDSIAAFITYLHKYDVHPDTIIKQLQDYFDFNKAAAVAEYGRWVDERQIERGRYENKKLTRVSLSRFSSL